MHHPKACQPYLHPFLCRRYFVVCRVCCFPHPLFFFSFWWGGGARWGWRVCVCVCVCVCLCAECPLVLHANCSVSVGSKGSAGEQDFQGWEWWGWLSGCGSSEMNWGIHSWRNRRMGKRERGKTNAANDAWMCVCVCVCARSHVCIFVVLCLSFQWPCRNTIGSRGSHHTH